MKLQKDQQFTVYLTPLTPVHIGCAVDYEPTDTLIHDKNLYHLKGLSDWQGVGREKLNQALRTPSLASIKAAFSKQADELKSLALRPVLMPFSTDNLWAESSKIRAEISKIKTIERTAFNAVTDNPIVPGSALKGAFRTAFIEQYGEQGKLDTDPLRQLKIADSSAQNKTLTTVSERRTRHKTEGFAKSNNVKDGSQNYAETVLPAQKECFTCEISNQSVEQKTHLQVLSIPSLLQQVCQHTFDTIQTELQRSRNIDDQFPLKLWWADHQSTLQMLKTKGAALIRIGRHSGSEQLSAAPIRRLKNKTGYPNYPITAAFAYDGKSLSSFGFMLLVPDYARAACDPILDQLLASMTAETAALADAQAAYEAHRKHCADQHQQWELDTQSAKKAQTEKAQAALEQAAAAKAAAEKAANQSPQQNAIDALIEKAQAKAAVLKGSKLDKNAAEYGWFSVLVKQAATENWPDADKQNLAAAVTEHLPTLIKGFLQTEKDGRKAIKVLLAPLNIIS